LSVEGRLGGRVGCRVVAPDGEASRFLEFGSGGLPGGFDAGSRLGRNRFTPDVEVSVVVRDRVRRVGYLRFVCLVRWRYGVVARLRAGQIDGAGAGCVRAHGTASRCVWARGTFHRLPDRRGQSVSVCAESEFVAGLGVGPGGAGDVDDAVDQGDGPVAVVEVDVVAAA
jgi:hypothetical protein